MEQNNVAVTSEVPTSVPPVTVATIEPKMTFEYASLKSRIVANFIDSLIISISTTIMIFVFGFIIALLSALGVDSESPVYLIFALIQNLLSMAIVFAYYVYFIGSKGQTLGKMAMKIKVVNESDGSVPGYGPAFLREVIGKFISSMVLFLGYLWMIWDSKKQGWHDKISHTVVIKVNPQATVQVASPNPIQQPVV